jgi:hypothetical protein
LTAAREALDKLRAAGVPIANDTNVIKESLKKVNLNEAMIGQFEKVIATLKAGVSTTEGRLTSLKDPREQVRVKGNVLEAAFEPYKKCVGDSAAPAAVKVVLDSFKKWQDDVAEELKVDDSLAEAVKDIQPKAEEFLNQMTEKARAANALGPVLDARTLRTELPKVLPGLATAMRLRRLFVPIAENLGTTLDPTKFRDIKELVAKKPDFKAQLASVDANLTGALAKLPGWADQAATAAQEEYVQAQDVLARAGRDPFHNRGEVLALATSAESARKEFESLSDSIQSILVEAQREDVPKGILPDGFVPDRVRDVSRLASSIQRSAGLFAAVTQQARTDIPLDKSTWSMDSIDLFYFDNVERLMRVLSPNVRLVSSLSGQDFQGQSRAARVALDEATQEFENAQAEVSDRRTEVANLQERLRLATARTNTAVQTQRVQRAEQRRMVQAAETRERTLRQRRMELEAQQRLAQGRFDRANTAASAKPDDVVLQRQLETAQSDLDLAKLRVDNAKAEEQRALDEATAARNSASGNTADIDEDVTTLRAELESARTALEAALGRRAAATTRHRTALRAAFLAAQAENFAFAQARDNAPFLTNLPLPKPEPSPGASPTATPAPSVALPDSDPVSRVLLFGFPDSRTIFIRGARDDIDLVRRLIKEFDRPQGQAMMTLRTMEVNSDGTQGGARRALKFLKRMDNEINMAQSNVEGAMTSLREAINKQVDQAVVRYNAELQQIRVNLETKIASLEEQKNRTADAAARATVQNGIEDTRNQIANVIARLNRSSDEKETIAFYDRQVLAALGWNDRFIDKLVDTRFLNAVIPRPSRTVNLAQALIALSLATPENRKGVINRLPAGTSLETRYTTTTTTKKGGGTTTTTETTIVFPAPPADATQTDPYASLRRFIGRDGSAADILGFQSELIEALRFNGITHVLEAAESLVRAELQITREIDEMRRQMPSTPATGQTTSGGLGLGGGGTDEPMNRLAARRGSINNTLDALLRWLQDNATGADPERLKRRIRETAEDETGTSNLLLEAVGLRRSSRSRFPQANESAVNLTFRKYLDQMHRDLTEVYVKPTFRRINEMMLKEKLGTGIIQETSILASNRLVARVDPRGSAQLAVGEEQNILEAARQLTNLGLGIAGQPLATGVTGNPLSLAGGAAGGVSTALQTAQSVFNALDLLPRDAPPSVYGIATGNVFQVTPVIDPSGQALRFRFDYVSATQIREPDDTIDPQLPRIERHSVNTEVLLADQELRLISQFQANSRVGLPTRKSGGIPIIKDIPGVSVVPLVGWFVRRGGRNSQTQHSFIFCQTMMYPTLSEVLDLAVQSPTFTGL